MASIKFNKAYIEDFQTITGPKESNSKLKKIDIAMQDYYYGTKTFEKTEIKMQKIVIDSLLAKKDLFYSDIDLIVGGDLLDQISATSYACDNLGIPTIGIYSACATYAESLIISSLFLQNSKMERIIGITSSHNLSAEKQFRYPVEYGSIRPHTSTFTTTVAVSSLITDKESKIRIESATIGKIIDKGVKDANNLGAVMVPACAETLVDHLTDLKRDIDYYDLILTGDLGCYGSALLKEYLLKSFNLKMKKHIDAGCELYLESQNVYSGGSGPGCLPLVLYNKIIPQKKYQKILIIGTGALHSKTLVNQKTSIPAIAHAVSLEVSY